jgi:competence protein ComEA
MRDTPPDTPSPLSTIIAFVVVALAVVGGIVVLLVTRPQPVAITIMPPAPTETPLPTASPAPLTIYVTGAVNAPGTLLTLPPGSRVQDALDAAGGVTAGADMTGVNLAALLRDGDQVHVPEPGGANTALATPSGGAVVRVNSATVDELATLPGVGPALAQGIVDHRDLNGPFASLDDLDEVSGIGPALLEELAGRVAFD